MNKPAADSGFDVIVVGAGGSGAPLAARLAEDPGCRVLLLEAGPAPASAAGLPAELLDAGTIRGADPAHPDNWAFPAHLTADRRYSIARGRILGGSTTVNGAYFVRARRADFDDWVAAGNPEWSYEKSLPFFRALEADEQFGDQAIHGGSGPMPVTRPALTQPGRAHPVTAAFAAAAAELGFAEEPDKNGEQPAGHGPLPMNVRGGVRWNTALAYLLPLGSRPNLVVRGGTTVRRVLFQGTRAVGVECVTDAGDAFSILGGEIVLAAGSVQSPRLLMLSGVGPKAELERHGIPVVADSPGVGVGFSDHPQVQLTWRPRPEISSAAAASDWTGPAMEWVLNVSGSVSENLPDGDGSNAIEILPMLKPMGYLLTGAVRTGDSPDLAILVAVQNEVSRGRIRLSSADPTSPPEIDYDYLSSAADVSHLRGAVRLAARVVGSAAFAAVSDGLTGLDEQTLGDDDRLDVWVRANLGTAIHLCGSARMGPDGDAGAVVDQYGRVRGVTGLRVADTSILPTVPRRGPAATAVLIGERIAAFMRAGS